MLPGAQVTTGLGFFYVLVIYVIVKIVTPCFNMYWIQEHRNAALKSGGPQRLNRVDLYGKNLIPMEKLQNLGGHDALAPIPMRMPQTP